MGAKNQLTSRGAAWGATPHCGRLISPAVFCFEFKPFFLPDLPWIINLYIYISQPSLILPYFHGCLTITFYLGSMNFLCSCESAIKRIAPCRLFPGQHAWPCFPRTDEVYLKMDIFMETHGTLMVQDDHRNPCLDHPWSLDPDSSTNANQH